MRELSSLIDMQVIATDEGKRLGTISQTLVDLAAGELVAVLLAGPPGKSLVAALGGAQVQERDRGGPGALA
jgi:sporulation protein YlmC with PRC-barrel domain